MGSCTSKWEKAHSGAQEGLNRAAMEMQATTCKYCGNQTPAAGVFCCWCGERIARKKREKGKAVKVPKPHRLQSGEWAAQLMVNGQRETVKGDSEAEYYERARAIKAGVLEGKKHHAPLTLSAAIDKHIAAHDFSPETVRGYRITQRRYLKLMQGNVWEITPEQIREALREEKKQYRVPKARKHGAKWGAVVEGVRILGDTPEEYERKAQELKREKHGAGLAPKTIKDDKGLICTVIHEATGARLEVSTARVVQAEHLFLEPEQISAFCRAIKGHAVEIPALLALSSLRRSELMHLSWADIDLNRRQIRVAGADVFDEHNKRVSKDENKNDTSRRLVPIMMNQLRDALQAVGDKSGRVVRCAPDTVRRRVNAICRENGLPEVGTHGLRHSFASLAAHLRMPQAIAQEIGGWANDKIMKEIYTHVAQTDRERFRNDMAAWYNGPNYYGITTEAEETQENQGV